MEFFTFLGITWAVLTVLNWIVRANSTGEKEQELRAELDRRIRVIRTEKLDEQSTILAYDAENNQFLGQGKTVEEMKSIVMERFPDRIFLLEGKPFSKMELNVQA